MLIVRDSSTARSSGWRSVQTCAASATTDHGRPDDHFMGERFDVMSIRRWRDRVLGAT